MGDDLVARLDAFLRPFEGKEVEWGRDDCSAICAAWARECGHDVKIPAYSSQEEAHMLIRKAGGLVALWDGIAASAGICERIGEPQFGDVGIIPTDRFGPVGVIFGGPHLCCWRHGKGAFWMAPRIITKVWAIT